MQTAFSYLINIIITIIVVIIVIQYQCIFWSWRSDTSLRAPSEPVSYRWFCFYYSFLFHLKQSIRFKLTVIATCLNVRSEIAASAHQTRSQKGRN